MKWAFVTRRRYEADLAAVRAETNRQRERAEKFEARAETWHVAQQTAARQFMEADAANRRLAGRNSALSDRLAAAQAASGFDHAQAKKTAERIARLQKAVARARAEAATAQGRADAAVRSELHRSKKAYGALEEQLLIVQKSNEVQARELRELREPKPEVSSS